MGGHLDLAATWEAASARIRDELGWVRTHAWLEAMRARSIERNLVRIEADSAAVRSAANEHSASIKDALGTVLGRPVQVRVSVARAPAPAAAPPPRRQVEAPSDVSFEPDRVNRANELSSFFTGPHNAIPLRFALQAVEQPGTWQPLLFYGESGSGKTHLLQGVVNSFRRRFPGRRVVYVALERFASHFSQARRYRQTHRFRELYRAADLLVIDDVEGIAGKPGTAQELCRTLDHFHLHGRQVVLACGTSPKHIPQLDPGLEGRLLGGQVVKLEPPDRATRLEIVRARSAAGSLQLDERVVELLASGFAMDVRELHAALTRIEAHQRHVNGALDLNTVRTMLRDLLQGKLKPATLEAIGELVAERLGLAPDALRDRSRKPSLVRARQLAMAISRELTPLTLREVGAYFGARSCASVHSAQERAKQMIVDDALAREVWEAASRTFEHSAR